MNERANQGAKSGERAVILRKELANPLLWVDLLAAVTAIVAIMIGCRPTSFLLVAPIFYLLLRLVIAIGGEPSRWLVLDGMILLFCLFGLPWLVEWVYYRGGLSELQGLAFAWGPGLAWLLFVTVRTLDRNRLREKVQREPASNAPASSETAEKLSW